MAGGGRYDCGGIGWPGIGWPEMGGARLARPAPAGGPAEGDPCTWRKSPTACLPHCGQLKGIVGRRNSQPQLLQR